MIYPYSFFLFFFLVIDKYNLNCFQFTFRSIQSVKPTFLQHNMWIRIREDMIKI